MRILILTWRDLANRGRRCRGLPPSRWQSGGRRRVTRSRCSPPRLPIVPSRRRSMVTPSCGVATATPCTGGPAHGGETIWAVSGFDLVIDMINTVAFEAHHGSRMCRRWPHPPDV